MQITEYFERRDTPQADSPVGRLMVRVLAKNPGMDFETAREESHKLLAKAGTRWKYTIPAVLSPEEQILATAKMKAAFAVSKAKNVFPAPRIEGNPIPAMTPPEA
jgi:hypothetical protein